MAVITDTFTGSNGSAPDAAKWTTYITTGSTVDIQSNALRLATGTLGSYTDRAQATSAAVPSTDFRVTMDLTPQGSGESYFEVPFRAATNGTSIDQDCYKFEVGSWGGVALIKVVNWSATSLGSAGITGYGAGTTVHLDYEVAGSTLTAYAWTGGGGRPGTPTVQVTDTAIAGAGYTGIFLVGGAATSATDWRVDDYSLTTWTGTASVAETVSVTAAGAAGGTASRTVTATVTAAGAGASSATRTTAATITANGALTGFVGSATVAETASLTANGSAGGTASRTATVGTTASGSGSGSADRATSVAITAVGAITGYTGTASVAETVSIAANGAGAGSASEAVTVSTTASGSSSSSASQPISVTITATGVVTGGGLSGTAARTETVGITATGRGAGSSNASVGVNISAVGALYLTGLANRAAVVTITATGTTAPFRDITVAVVLGDRRLIAEIGNRSASVKAGTRRLTLTGG